MKTIAIAALLLVSSLADAIEPVGYVKTQNGEASITSSGNKVRAAPGTAVYQGSQIKTAKGASLGITFVDNTVMSFGSDTELTVDEYVFNPNQGDLKFASKLGKGTLNYVSGAIARLKPEAVAVKTPSGVIGVRCTHFAILV